MNLFFYSFNGGIPKEFIRSKPKRKDRYENYYALPISKVLDGKGYVWESFLAGLGWNELPDNKKPLKLLKYYTDGTCILFSEALNHKTGVVFRDEILIMKKDKSK